MASGASALPKPIIFNDNYEDIDSPSRTVQFKPHYYHNNRCKIEALKLYNLFNDDDDTFYSIYNRSDPLVKFYFFNNILMNKNEKIFEHKTIYNDVHDQLFIDNYLKMKDPI
jgi:hypothetical protein